jgi:hypothetical protein
MHGEIPADRAADRQNFALKTVSQPTDFGTVDWAKLTIDSVDVRGSVLSTLLKQASQPAFPSGRFGSSNSKFVNPSSQ